MDREALGGAQLAQEVDVLLQRGPGAHDRHGNHVDARDDRVEGVAGMEEGGLAVGAEHEAGVGDAGDVAVDDRVPPAHGRDVDASHVELVAGDQRPGPSAEIDCVDDAGLHCDDGVRVGRQQCRDALGVDVVGVVMRHQDGVQAGESVPRGAEVARIDEDAGARRLDEHGRVTQVRELHADHPTRCLWRGQA